jgi:putative ABC transport system permease protein
MRAAAGRLSAAWKLLTGTGAAASAALALLVLGCVLVSLAVPRASLGQRTQALRQILTPLPAVGTAVTGTIGYSSFDTSYGNTPVTARDIAGAEHRLAAKLAAARLPLAGRSSQWSGLATGFSPVGGAAPSAVNGGIPPQLEVLYRDALPRDSRLITGRLPGRASITHGLATFQVAVTAATARRFGLRPGSRLRLGAFVRLQVTAIVRPVHPAAAFWTADSLAAAPELSASANSAAVPHWLGAAFVGPAELPLVEEEIGAQQLTWTFPADLGRMSAAQVSTLASQLTMVSSQDGQLDLGPEGIPTDIDISTGLTAILMAFLQQEQNTGSLLGLLSVSLAVLAGVVVLLASRLVAGRRGSEFQAMRARGASLRQLGLLALQAGAAVTVPAAAAGAAVAIALTPGDTYPPAWWLAALVMLAALAGPPAFAVAALRHGTVNRTGRTSQRGRATARRAAARRLVAEVTLTAAAIGGLIVLRQQGPAAGGIDLYPSMAPVLIAVPAAILVTRLYPVLVRVALRLASRRPGVTAFIGLAQAARAQLGSVLPAFALILALAVVACGEMIGAAVLRAQVAASWQQVGADAVIQAATSNRPLTTRVVRDIAAVPGAARTATTFVSSGSLPGGGQLGVAVVRPAQYARLIADTPAPPFRAAALRGAADRSQPTGPVPVLASPSAAALIGPAGTTVQIGTGRLRIRVVGKAGPVPGGPTGQFIVLPQWALAARAIPDQPNVVLVTGPHLDGGTLTAVARRQLPGAIVTLRSAALARLTGAPLPRSAARAITETTIAAAGLSVLILLIWLVLSAGSRELMLARLATMGLEPGQARRLVAIEALPLVLAAAVGGVASAIALAPLVGPAVNLSAFTGSARASVPIAAEPALLAVAAAALLVVALLALVAQTVITDRRGSARALRVGQ